MCRTCRDFSRKERKGREEILTQRSKGAIFVILWLVLPMTFGCVAVANDGSFWIGFFLGAIANGVLRFLWNPFGF